MASRRVVVLGLPPVAGGDHIAPVPVITSAAAATVYAAFDVTITFSEDVTGFVVGDITVTNGTAGSFSATSASVYTATITPTFLGPTGTVTVSVAAGVCQDAAGNANTASNDLTRAWDYASFIIGNYSPTLFALFNETSGNLINYGSDGNSATVSGATQGQTGQLGANEACSFDGVDDVCTFANASVAVTKALTTQRWVWLCKPTGLGESNLGTLYTYGNVGSQLRLNATNSMLAIVKAATTDAAAQTNNNQVDFINAWTLVFMDYDDGNALGLGRRIRIMRATAASATTLLTLATNTAAVDAAASQAADLIIGNRALTDRTFAGLIDFAFAGAGLWSPAGTPADLTIPARIRQLVFGV